ncbi:MAG: polysaccharide biosynthesis/export family protein [Candidatus Eremiobacteraeota bacterium]|nr:polysaccharide biosynthesis/export family protein [Candidatus Eremiobacteraeota bacterium]MBV8367140.1 polysaccharide biosynthesis/export family protein [Candidatus Eremiobacteraeota bacterium]
MCVTVGATAALCAFLALSTISSAQADPIPAAPGGAPTPTPAAQPAPAKPQTPVGPGFGPGVPNTHYTINGGDQLAVTVYGEKDLPTTATVLPDGDIDYPLAGVVHIGGMTPTQAEHALAAALGKYIRHPVVSISVVQEGQINVLVLGNVKAPGKYQLPSGGRATDAIAAAGGLGPVNGDYPQARVADASGNVKQVDLQKVLHDGDTSGNVSLTDQSTVYVPSPNTFNVEVFGAVDKPGDVTLNEGDGLAMAIARAAPSSASNPDLNRVEIRRVSTATGQVQTMTVNLYQVLQTRDLSKDTPMQKGDIVFVPQARSHPAGGPLMNFISSLFFWIPK